MNIRFIFLITIFNLLICTNAIFAQPGCDQFTLTFKCLTKDNKPIKANIIFPLSKKIIQTDNNGLWSFTTIIGSGKNIFYAKTESENISKLYTIKEVFLSTSKPFPIYIPDTNYYKPYYANRTCPICKNGEFIIPIVYGNPTQKVLEKEERGEIKLGGCERKSLQLFCKKHNFSF